MSEASRREERISAPRAAVALVVVSLGALLVRCRYIGDVFLEKRLLPYDPDSAYHLWRIEEAVRGFAPPRFDPFLNAPEGAGVIYPDGFDGLLGLLARLLFGSDASRFEIAATSFFAVPMLGMLAVVAVYFVARIAFGRVESIAAGCIAAIIPSHVLASYIGQVDHHVLELLLPVLAVIALLGGRARTWRDSLRRGAVAALPIAALSYSVPTALLHVAIIFTGVVAAGLHAGREEPDHARDLFRCAIVAFGVAALLTIPDALGRSGLAFYEPSRLPPLALAAVCASAALFAHLSARGWRALLIGVGATAALGLLVAVFVLGGALGFIGREGILVLVRETAPLWEHPRRAVELHTLLLPALPIIFVLMARASREPAAWAIAAMGCCGAVLAVAQERFMVLLSMPTAVLLAAAATWLWTRRGWLHRGGLALAAIVAFSLPIKLLLDISLVSMPALARLEAAEWLAANTPSPGERRGSGSPSYTVLARWSDGPHIAYLARRPLIGSTFYHGDFARGTRDSMHALYGDHDSSMALLEKRRARYVVLSVVPQSTEAAQRAVLGLSNPPPLPTLFTHLYDFDGSATRNPNTGQILKALAQLRLVHDSPLESKRGDRDVPAVKIFERVRGALLVGVCDSPGAQVVMKLESDAGRSFRFVNGAPCDGGQYSVRVPYAGVATVLVGPGTAPREVAVSERDVIDGRDVFVP